MKSGLKAFLIFSDPYQGTFFNLPPTLYSSHTELSLISPLLPNWALFSLAIPSAWVLHHNHLQNIPHPAPHMQTRQLLLSFQLVV